MIINGFGKVFRTDILCHTQQLPKQHVGLVLGNQGVDFSGGLAVVEVAALHRKAFQKGSDEAQKYLRLANLDEVDGLAIGLQGTKGILFADLRVVVQGAKDDFVVLGELFYLVECPQLIAFFKRKGNAGQEYKDLHLGMN